MRLRSAACGAMGANPLTLDTPGGGQVPNTDGRWEKWNREMSCLYCEGDCAKPYCDKFDENEEGLLFKAFEWTSPRASVRFARVNQYTIKSHKNL